MRWMSNREQERGLMNWSCTQAESGNRAVMRGEAKSLSADAEITEIDFVSCSFCNTTFDREGRCSDH